MSLQITGESAKLIVNNCKILTFLSYCYLNKLNEPMSFRLLTRSDTNLAVQPQQIARGLKFWIKKVEGLHFL